MSWTQTIYQFGRHKRSQIDGRNDNFVRQHRIVFLRDKGWRVIVDDKNLLIVIWAPDGRPIETWVYRKEDST